MRGRLVTSVLAAAGLGLLGCDRVSTAPQTPYHPSFITSGAAPVPRSDPLGA